MPDSNPQEQEPRCDYYIRYQVDRGADIKERVGRKSCEFYSGPAKEALNSRLGNMPRRHFNLEKTRWESLFQSLRSSIENLPVDITRLVQESIGQELADLFGNTPLVQFTSWQVEKWKSDEPGQYSHRQ